MAILGSVGGMLAAICQTSSVIALSGWGYTVSLANPEHEEPFEEQEIKVHKEATPQTPISSSSLNETVISPLPLMADDFHQFQTL